MGTIIAEVSLVPMGTGTSLSFYVAKAVKVLRDRGLKHILTPMCTVIEGEWDEVFQVVKEMHEAVFATGALRVVTSLKVDDRRDIEEISMERKVRAIDEKLTKDM